jgi:hypothetical protein
MGLGALRWAAVVAVGFFLTSCEKDLGNLGLDLIGAGEFKTGALKSIPVVTSTERYDTLLTSNTGIFPVGGFQDAVFGRVDAYAVTQVALGRINPRFGTNPTAESVYFFLPVTDWYGDTTVPLRLVVQPLLDPLVADSAYTASDVFGDATAVASTGLTLTAATFDNKSVATRIKTSASFGASEHAAKNGVVPIHCPSDLFFSNASSLHEW